MKTLPQTHAKPTFRPEIRHFCPNTTPITLRITCILNTLSGTLTIHAFPVLTASKVHGRARPRQKGPPAGTRSRLWE